PRRGSAFVYAVASGSRARADGALRLMSVASPATVAPRRLTINELTTVASVYSLSQFLHGVRIAGPSPGLANAAATVPELVDPASGTVGSEIANPPNGTDTDSLASFRTLADVLAGCSAGTRLSCRRLLRAATPPRGPRPRNTLDAIHAIALNPANHARLIFHLRKGQVYRPTLTRAPTSWVLSLKHTDGGYDGPGRMAFDSHGNIWVTNNFEPPGTDSGTYAIALDPTGHPRAFNPVRGGGVDGVWWGIAIDEHDRVWLSNFTGDDPNEFYSSNFMGGTTSSLFAPGGTPLSPSSGFALGNLHAPQGIAVDVHGNVWIANHGNATVTEYVGGNPNSARVFSGGGLNNPFTIVTDAQGNVWVDNGAIDAADPGTLTEITSSGQVIGPFSGGGMRSPQGMAIDQAGNLWVSSLVSSDVTEFGPDGRIEGTFRVPSVRGGWGIAIDGQGNVWVASFVGKTVTELCGQVVSHCPPGAKTGDPISPRLNGFGNGGLQHLTGLQIDESGNVWVANNWASIVPIVGGDGLVEFIGAAPPVKTPLIGQPTSPSR
ncbi:MAG TPA: NHL repeat-containing protein, partial [Mycobacterium sp.]|nr:NHL repeat-containing protein [Mycobacterium sp.]